MDIQKRVKDHYLKFLGVPRFINKLSLRNGNPLEIIEYWDTPCPDAVVLATVGTSSLLEDPLNNPHQALNQELIFMCYKHFLDERLIKLITLIAEDVNDSSFPLSRGNILGPAGPLSPTTTMEALYNSPPSYYEPEFHHLNIECVDIDFFWLIPIYRIEAEWIVKHGGDEFESLLEAQDPDLLDLTRAPLSLDADDSPALEIILPHRQK